MTEHAPEVTEADARRILRRDYPEVSFDELWGTIQRLETRFKWRTILGCLKNAGGSLERLRGQLKDAPGYYREIMGEAEYPEATKKWSRIEELPAAEQQAIHDRDRRQYEAWLHRGDAKGTRP